MPQRVNIDNLARLARERNDEPAWKSLWNAVLSLPAWYGVGAFERPNVPMIFSAGNPAKPVLFAFTDEARARCFVDREPPRGRPLTVIRMPLPNVIRYAASLGPRGVEHIVFNASRGVEGFGFPIAALAQLAAALGRPATPPDTAAPPPPPSPPPPPAGQ